MTSQYSIHELEKLSGIKAHTIRIWEKRYGLLEPLRTETNIRYYSNDDLRKLLNVSSLLNRGWKISGISRLSALEINREITETLQQKESAKEYLPAATNALISALMEYDEERFDKAFSLAVLKLGFTEAVIRVIYPVLEKIGLLWSTDRITPAHEHFISCLVRQKFLSATDSLMLQPGKKGGYMLFLPEGELHEIGLLMANYLIRAAGKKTIYLGQSVPFDNVVATWKAIRPEKMLFFIVTPQYAKAALSYIKKLVKECPGTEILLCGKTDFLKNERLPSAISCLKRIDELQTILNK